MCASFFSESRPGYWAGQVKVGMVNSGSIQERISYYRANAGQANVGRGSIAGESINEQGRKKKNDKVTKVHVNIKLHMKFFMAILYKVIGLLFWPCIDSIQY